MNQHPPAARLPFERKTFQFNGGELYMAQMSRVLWPAGAPQVDFQDSEWLSSFIFGAHMRNVTVTSKADFQGRVEDWKREDEMARKERLNNNFVQFAGPYISTVARLASESPAAAALLLFLVARMDRVGSVCCDVATMMEGTDRKQSAVYEALKKLETEKWFERRTVDGASFFRINSRVFWAASNDQRYRGFDSELNRPIEPEVANQRLRVTLRETRPSRTGGGGQRAAGE